LQNYTIFFNPPLNKIKKRLFLFRLAGKKRKTTTEKEKSNLKI